MAALMLPACLAACHPGRPAGVIGDGDMERILYDYHIAQAIADNKGDSAEAYRYASIQKVFEKHGVTQAEFDSSMVWYSTNMTSLYKIYNRLYERLDAEVAQAGQGALGDMYASLTADGDTANIWMGEKMLSLMQATNSNNFTFAYVADSTFLNGDEFLFRGKMRFMQRDGAREAVMALMVHYDGDSTATVMRQMRTDGAFELCLFAGNTLPIRAVSGFIYYNTTENKGDAERRLLIINPMLIRIHQKEGR